MQKVRCIYCGFECKKYGRTKAGTQRWKCKACKSVFCNRRNDDKKYFKEFLKWLFSKTTQKEMHGEGRTFRRRTSKFWNIWPMPPLIEQVRDIVYVDGIYLGRKACILICSDDTHVLGWYLCRNEHAKAWESLMRRIAAPKVVVSDGGSGFLKALKNTWPKTKHQRCIFHAFSQVKRYTTRAPKTLAGKELYALARNLLKIRTKEEAIVWIQEITQWRIQYKDFLKEMTQEPNGTLRPTHERLIKAEKSLVKLINNSTLFTYLDASLDLDIPCPSTNNRIEGAVNASLRDMLRNHKGMSIERRIKAVFWWCYMHSPKPLSLAEILTVMPTNKSISDLYNTMNSQSQLEGSIPSWGDAIVWSEFHNYDENFHKHWD